jgi:hypothetical protein
MTTNRIDDILRLIDKVLGEDTTPPHTQNGEWCQCPDCKDPLEMDEDPTAGFLYERFWK